MPIVGYKRVLHKCTRCKGTGSVELPVKTVGIIVPIPRPCPNCKGQGHPESVADAEKEVRRVSLDQIPLLAKKTAHKEVCFRCKGSGISKRRVLSALNELVSDNEGVCTQCNGDKELKHPWFGKQVMPRPLVVITQGERPDGTKYIEGTLGYDVI